MNADLSSELFLPFLIIHDFNIILGFEIDVMPRPHINSPWLVILKEELSKYCCNLAWILSPILPLLCWCGSCFLVTRSSCEVTQLIGSWVTSTCPFFPAAGKISCSLCPSFYLTPCQVSSVMEVLCAFYFPITGIPNW